MPLDFDFTTDQLTQCCPKNNNADDLLQALNDVLPKYEITSVNRVAGFLSQCGHEQLLSEWKQEVRDTQLQRENAETGVCEYQACE